MLLSTLLAALPLFAPSLVSAFSFSLGTTPDPVQCGTVNVTWTGGSAPFNMTIIPAFDYPSVVSIPSSSYDTDSSTGSYSWTVDYPSGTQFVAMMSDSTGTGTGGVSQLYTVSAASGSSSCSLRSTTTDFLFYLNETSLTQCDDIEVYWDSTAVAPVSILGVIPSGQVFQLATSSSSATSLVWNTNIASGTKVILAAFDHSTSYQGGSSSLFTIAGSSNSACLDDSSPSSTPAVATATGTSTGTGSSTKTAAAGGGVKTVTAIATKTALAKGAAGLSSGAIVGIVVVAVIAVIALQGALLWFCCRRQIRSLLTHRREMKGQEVKPGGVVDLVDTSRASMASEDPYAGLTADSTTRYSLARSGDREFDSPGSVSPFWDGAAVPPSTSRSTSDGPPMLDLAWDPEPPRAPHIHSRHESQSSSGGQSFADSFHNSIGGGGGGGYHDASPSPSLAALLPPTPSLQQNRYSAMSYSSSRPNLSKAQMAAALSASNPDPSPSPSQSQSQQQSGSGQRGGQDDLAGPYLPRQEAPPGGFRFHEDAGRADVEDLPPMYRPEWGDGTDSQQQPRQQRREGSGAGA